jgi:hypothetical protein
MQFLLMNSEWCKSLCLDWIISSSPPHFVTSILKVNMIAIIRSDVSG